MTKKRISVKSAKAKGRIFQQQICEKISNLINIPWGPNEPIASREGGQAGTDVRLIGEAKYLFPWSVENKFQESWSIHDWIKQAKENRLKNTNWLLFCKRSHQDPIVIMDAEEFFKLFEYVELGYLNHMNGRNR